MNKTVIEAKTGEEGERIFRFRDRVFLEDSAAHAHENDDAAPTLRDDLDARATHLYLEHNGEIAGALRIVWGGDGIPNRYAEWYGLARFAPFAPATLSFCGHLIVAPELRRTLAALALARRALRLKCERGIAFDFVHATPDNVPFFYRLGYRRFVSDFVDPDLGTLSPMVLVINDLEYLQSCRSPLVSHFATPPERHPACVEWFRREFSADTQA